MIIRTLLIALLSVMGLVHGGDTIKILNSDKKQVRVRLYGIDCPESKQAYGSKAKKHLSSLVFGKTVTLTVMDTDRYGRKVCKVHVDKTYVNLAMVEAGFAWHYKHFAPKDDDLAADAHTAARKANKGLWADKNPTPPWDFRKKPKAGTEPVAGTTYWLNTSSNTRHNNRCIYYMKTKKGRPAKADAGKPCGRCGG